MHEGNGKTYSRQPDRKFHLDDDDGDDDDYNDDGFLLLVVVVDVGKEEAMATYTEKW